MVMKRLVEIFTMQFPVWLGVIDKTTFNLTHSGVIYCTQKRGRIHSKHRNLLLVTISRAEMWILWHLRPVQEQNDLLWMNAIMCPKFHVDQFWVTNFCNILSCFNFKHVGLLVNLHITGQTIMIKAINPKIQFMKQFAPVDNREKWINVYV